MTGIGFATNDEAAKLPRCPKCGAAEHEPDRFCNAGKTTITLDAMEPGALPKVDGVGVEVLGDDGWAYQVRLSGPPAEIIAYVRENWGDEMVEEMELVV